MFGLQAVIHVPTRIIKEAKCATHQIILNTDLWGFKTDVLETALSDHFGQKLQSGPVSLPEKKLQQNKTIHNISG
jgi:hypothetical protein